jgi:DNA-binding PadR family transcriptional regulator
MEEYVSTRPEECVVLGLLMRRPQHGYEIHRLLATGLGRVWRTGRSEIYALLKNLEASRRVASVTEVQDNRPARKVYSITAEGREAFLDWIKEPVPRVRDVRFEFLAKLSFMRELSIPGSRRLIKRQIGVCRGRLESVQGPDESPDYDFNRLVSRFRACQIEAVLKWLGECSDYFKR